MEPRWRYPLICLLFLTVAVWLAVSRWTTHSDIAPPTCNTANDHGPPPRQAFLRVLVGNLSVVSRPFKVYAFVLPPPVGESATLILPPELTLVGRQPVQKTIPPPGDRIFSTLMWEVQASTAGKFTVEVQVRSIGTSSTVVEVPWARSHWEPVWDDPR